MAAMPLIPARRMVPPPPPANNGSSTSTVQATAGRSPPPPPTNASAAKPLTSASNDAEPALGGIAARIAALKLSQVSGSKPLGNDASPAPIRSRVQRSNVPESAVSSPNGLTKTAKRAPPPVPSHTRLSEPKLKASASEELEEGPAPILPTLPPRKVPPLPARRATKKTVTRQRSSYLEREGEHELALAPTIHARRLPPPPAPHSPSPEVAPTPPPPVNRSTRPTINYDSRPSFAALDVAETPQHEYESEYGADSGHGSGEPEAPADASEEETCLKCRFFEVVDEHAAQFPRENVVSLEQLAYDLTAPFESATDKARAIFVWLHHNIAYDAYSFLMNCMQPQTPEGVLHSGLAVCAGYAGLFKELADLSGLHALQITGHGKGYGHTETEGGTAPPYNGNHAWNAVVMDDNEWHLIDACWGAGALGDDRQYHKGFTPAFFTSTNIEFGRKHFPDDPTYQMREDGTAVSWEEYILAPPGPLVTTTFHQHNYDRETLLPDDKYIVGGYDHDFHVQTTCWHLEKRSYWSDYVLMLLVDVGGQQIREVIDRVGNYEGWTRRLYIPPGDGSAKLAVITTCNNQDARGMDPHQVLGVGRRAMTWEILVQWEVI